jgi:putative ABC transport system ATP-binding protein
MSENIIRVERVTKTYQRGGETLKVLDNLSLDIEQGQFLALMGPSGSGKTSLLNIIAGLDKPDSGKVTAGGVETSGLSENQLAAWRAAHIGFVFQFYNLLPVLTAVENVALPLGLLKMNEREKKERAEFALQVVGLADRGKHFPSQLSGGQEQRVAIARAIVTDPTIIVADEPTGDLDRKSAGEILDLLKRLNNEHSKNIVMVTHDQAAAEYASRTIHLDKGQILGAH